MAMDPQKLKLKRDLSRAGILFSIARQASSQRVFAGASDGRVYAYDLAEEKPKPVDMTGHSSYVTGATVAGNQLVTGGYDRKLIWWNIDDLKPVRTVKAHARWIRRVTSTPDGKWVLSVADDMVARVWDAETGEMVKELKGHEAKTPHHFPSMLYAVTTSADGRLAATADRVGRIVVWDLEQGTQRATLEAPLMYTWDPKARIHSIGGIRSVAFSHDGKRLAAGGIGQIGNIDHLGALARVEVFEWESGKRTHEFKGDKFKGLVEHLAFHPEGPWLLGAGGDHNGFIQVYNLDDSKIVKQEKAPGHVHDLAVSDDWSTIYGAAHGRLIEWQIPVQEE